MCMNGEMVGCCSLEFGLSDGRVRVVCRIVERRKGWSVVGWRVVVWYREGERSRLRDL